MAKDNFSRGFAQGEHGNYLPKLPKDLADQYRQFYSSLSPAQLAQLGGAPHPSNLTDEINPSVKYSNTPDTWDTFGERQAHTSLGQSLVRCLSSQPDIDPADLSANQGQHLHPVAVLEIIRRVLLIYTTAPDTSTRLHGEVVAMALGFPGLTVSTLSRKYGVTRQAISKRLRNIIKGLGLPPTSRMLSQASPAIKAILAGDTPTPPLHRQAKRHRRPSKGQQCPKQ